MNPVEKLLFALVDASTYRALWWHVWPFLPVALPAGLAVVVPALRRFAPALVLATLLLALWFGRWDGVPRLGEKIDITPFLWLRALQLRTGGGALVVLLGVGLAAVGSVRTGVALAGAGLSLLGSGWLLSRAWRAFGHVEPSARLASLSDAVWWSNAVLVAGLAVGLAAWQPWRVTPPSPPSTSPDPRRSPAASSSP